MVTVSDDAGVTADEMSCRLGRGISFGNALDGLREGDAGLRLCERYFAEVRDAGFDTVRLPVKRLGLSWCYWDFGTDFGAYDPGRNALREPLRDALLGDGNPLAG
jgi:hypothetical protein